jgi:hypothetical protein
MKAKRKIQLTVKKVSFSEAESADDKYWAKATVAERLQELIDLRKLVFGDSASKMKKIVSQRSIHDVDKLKKRSKSN